MRNNLAKLTRSPLGRSRFYWTLRKNKVQIVETNYKKHCKNTCKVKRNIDLFKKICIYQKTFNEIAKIYGLNRSTVRDIVYEMYIKNSRDINTDIIYYNRSKRIWGNWLKK